MHTRHTWLHTLLAVLLSLTMVIGPAVPAFADEAPTYDVQVATDPADTTALNPGTTVNLTAVVTKTVNGLTTEVTEFAENEMLWFWVDTWNEHADGKNTTVTCDENGKRLTASTAPMEEGTYYIAAEFQVDGHSVATKFATLTVATQQSEGPTPFEGLPARIANCDDVDAFELSGGFTQTANDADLGHGNYLNWWTEQAGTAEAKIKKTFTLAPGRYEFTATAMGEVGEVVKLCVNDAESQTELATAEATMTGWTTEAEQFLHPTAAFTLTEQTTVALSVVVATQNRGWGKLDDFALTLLPEEDTTVQNAAINVTKVPGLREGFLAGVDISSVVSELNSGVVFRDAEGNALYEATDSMDTKLEKFCRLLAASGVNAVRVRVWNDPYDTSDNGYGGGNNDLATAQLIGAAAAKAGMETLLDLHYSDFWADPGKQQAPKVWAELSLDDKAQAAYDWTTECLNGMKEAGANVTMIQIGNETNGKFCGETTWDGMCTVFSAGSKATRDFDPNVKIALHFTNPEKAGRQEGYAKELANHNVDYDVFATSYYPYWHGSLSNLTSVLNTIAKTYDKEVMVAETSYANTLADTDGHDNTVRVGNNDAGSDLLWNFTVQGQANEFRDVVDAVNKVENGKGIGVFYWEGAWITVGDTTGLTGDALQAQIDANKGLWEQYGSGWASSFATEYDREDAGQWFGGSAVDNQAFFGPDGRALASLDVFRYLRTGAVNPNVTVESVETPAVEVTIGADVSLPLPQTVQVTLNNGKTETLTITWEQESYDAALAALKDGKEGTYAVTGTVIYEGQPYPANAVVTVLPKNYLPDPGFEEEPGAWTMTGVFERSTSDVHSGNYAAHFWSGEAFETELFQTLTNLEAGVYALSCYVQGGDTGAEDVLALWYQVDDGERVCANTKVTGWKNWATPKLTEIEVPQGSTLTVGFTIQGSARAWGTVDDFTLSRTGDYVAPTTTPVPTSTPAPTAVPGKPVKPIWQSWLEEIFKPKPTPVPTVAPTVTPEPTSVPAEPVKPIIPGWDFWKDFWNNIFGH